MNVSSSINNNNSNTNYNANQSASIYKDFQKYNDSIKALNSIQSMQILKEKRGEVIKLNSYKSKYEKPVVHRSCSVQRMLQQKDKNDNNAVIKIKRKDLMSFLSGKNTNLELQMQAKKESIRLEVGKRQKLVQTIRMLNKHEIKCAPLN